MNATQKRTEAHTEALLSLDSLTDAEINSLTSADIDRLTEADAVRVCREYPSVWRHILDENKAELRAEREEWLRKQR